MNLGPRLAGAVLFVAAAVAACGDDDDATDLHRQCDSSNCSGCCDEFGTCFAGTEVDACGKGGDFCVECPEQNACSDAGTCVACNPNNCLGCCDDEGICQPGDQREACGDGGEACSECGGPQFPNAFTCYELDLD